MCGINNKTTKIIFFIQRILHCYKVFFVHFDEDIFSGFYPRAKTLFSSLTSVRVLPRAEPDSQHGTDGAESRYKSYNI